jgi:large subunit ribosomal protein L19
LPALQKVEINKGAVRRARIFYFRQLTGKKAKLKTKEDSLLSLS